MMEWKDVSQKIGAVAPLLGALIGSPVATRITAIVSAALGVAATPGEVAQALTTDPDALVKLKQIEATHETELQALLVSAEANRLAADTAAMQAEVADRDSARKMLVNTRSATPTILSYVVLIGGGVMMASVLMGWAVADSVLAGTLIGYVVGEMKQVVAYWFGTTSGSRDKTAMLADRGKSTD